MKLVRRQFLRLAGASAAAPILVRRALAQSFPARPVRVIVPFAPGGFTDVTARLIAGKIGEQLGRQVYVENLSGGSGNIGMGQAAKAAPDGYTMLAADRRRQPSLFDRVPRPSGPIRYRSSASGTDLPSAQHCRRR
jgi:hypothetical protein